MVKQIEVNGYFILLANSVQKLFFQTISRCFFLLLYKANLVWSFIDVAIYWRDLNIAMLK